MFKYYSKKNILIFFCLFFLIDFLILTKRNVKQFLLPEWLHSWGFGAITLPPFGIFYNKNQFVESTYNHEMVHINQWKRKGTLLYYFDYLVNSLLYGYRNNPLEVEAYGSEKK